MPHHNGVLAASIILFACLGVNMVAFPEVWTMFRNDSSSVVTASTKTPIPSSLPVSTPTVPATKPASEPDKLLSKEPVSTAKSTNIDKPIPIDPPKNKEESASAPKSAPVPMPAPKKEEPTPKPQPLKEESTPKPTSALESPPKKEEFAPKPSPKKEEVASKPVPAPELTPKKEAPIPKSEEKVASPPTDPFEKNNDLNVRASAFAPIIPSKLRDPGSEESLLPKSETVESPLVSTKVPTPSLATPAYANEFKPKQVSNVPNSEPVYETIDSVLARPIVYESHPTIDQRVGETLPKVVQLPSPTTTTLKPFSPVSPTGPVRRLPLAN